MGSCEKCWRDAGGDPDRYSQLIVERNRVGQPPLCTPEDQAGPDAGKCPVCGRMTVHQWTSARMCGCSGHSAR